MPWFWQQTFASRATPQENPFHFPSRSASKIACLSFSMMVEEVREAIDEGNQKFFGGLEYHILSTVRIANVRTDLKPDSDTSAVRLHARIHSQFWKLPIYRSGRKSEIGAQCLSADSARGVRQRRWASGARALFGCLTGIGQITCLH